MKTIYLIGSLKNRKIIDLGNKIRGLGYDVFDDWIGPGEEADDKFDEYRKKRGLNYKDALSSYAAQHIFHFDRDHLDRSDIVILVMPAGKSGHLELGYCIGKGKTGYILMDKEPDRVDIMHSFATEIFMKEEDLLKKLTRDWYGKSPIEDYQTRIDRYWKEWKNKLLDEIVNPPQVGPFSDGTYRDIDANRP